MAKTLLDLAARLRAKGAELDEHAHKLKKKIAHRILEEFTDVTPVDTSTAVSNWIVALGSPINAPIPAYFPGFKGSTAAQSAIEALSVGKQIIEQSKPGESIYISNVVDYIKYLDDGPFHALHFIAIAGLLASRVIEAEKGIK